MKISSAFVGISTAAIASVAFLSTPAAAATIGQATVTSAGPANPSAWVHVESFWYGPGTGTTSDQAHLDCEIAAIPWAGQGIATQCIDMGSSWDLLRQI
ncbi:hypothetical protein E1292_39470 [Nonomuraea deserti]|uniref:Uncharacterized protein n=1 Tax=Nonomuraea deserti TaxID=1848322 RepID=A0A4V2Y889_9ACTN|nr:hypothetical protein [Nonomuraea deserti]TDC94995.1 hypothetical protein E1292_39470 [Nonomuraea deserti]